MIYVFTLGFAPARILEKSFEQLYKTTSLGSKNFVHVYLDQHYPIDKERNMGACRIICDMYGITYIDAGKNLGLHVGFNKMLDLVNLKPDDVVIAYDADSFPTESGWDSALISVLSDPNFGWVTIMNPRCKQELIENGYEVHDVAAYEVWTPRKDIVNSTCAWRGDFLIRSKGLHESRPFYGHLESSMWGKPNEQGLRWGFLPAFPESDHLRDLHDRDLVVYKWCHAHLKSWDGDFESWLAAGKPNPEDNAPARLP